AIREELASAKTPQAELINLIEAKVNKRRTGRSWITCDQLAMAWMIDNIKNRNAAWEALETLETSTKQCHATVELQGRHTRGQMVIDHQSVLKRKPNATILTGVSMPVYQEYLKAAFTGKF
ncbi:hypothetical protein SK128_006633, partial [Halocaridina rubra]